MKAKELIKFIAVISFFNMCLIAAVIGISLDKSALSALEDVLEYNQELHTQLADSARAYDDAIKASWRLEDEIIGLKNQLKAHNIDY